MIGRHSFDASLEAELMSLEALDSKPPLYIASGANQISTMRCGPNSQTIASPQWGGMLGKGQTIVHYLKFVGSFDS